MKISGFHPSLFYLPSSPFLLYNPDMQTIRRHDLSPRLEMIPMIDVIFLLLTFFIYNMVIMHHTKVLPVKLVSIAGGSAPSSKAIHVITIDRNGLILFDRQVVKIDALDRKLAELAADSERRTLFLAVEQQGIVDRGPLFIRLIERVVEAGIIDFAIIGPSSGREGGEGRSKEAGTNSEVRGSTSGEN